VSVSFPPEKPKKLSLKELESYLWKSLDIFRPAIRISECKEYLLGILSLKYLSDTFEEAQENLRHSLDLKGKSKKEINLFIEDPNNYSNIFFIPKNSRWNDIRNSLNVISNIGLSLNKSTQSIEDQNPGLSGVLSSINFDINNKKINQTFKELIDYFSIYKLTNANFEKTGLLGQATDYLIKMFADSEGKMGGQFYTPNEVIKLLIDLVKPGEGMDIYDPTCGTGGILISARNYVEANGQDTSNVFLSGQEINFQTLVVCKLNMLLHGIFNSDIKSGDTLQNPQHIKNEEIMKFDRVVANPPFSLRNWGREYAENDFYQRYQFGVPPKHSGDMAFVQHMIASLKDDGVMGVVVTHGVLLRGGAEGEIRRGILENDLLEAVIGLPSLLLPGTSIPCSLLIINKKKKPHKKGKVLFIDASHNFRKEKLKNIIGQDEIGKIVSCFDSFEEIDSFSKIVSINQLKNNLFNLYVKRYADASPESLEIKRLQDQYKSYKSFALADLVIEVNNPKLNSKFEEIENCIYIPRFPSKDCFIDLSAFNGSHDHIFQVVLNSEKVLNRYLLLFLTSNLGKLLLKSCCEYSVQPSLKWGDDGLLRELKVPIPEKKNQLKQIEASEKLSKLNQKIDQLENNFALSPVSTGIVLEQLDGMLELLGGLTDAEKVLSLIRQGESAELEFKETFSLCIRRQTKEKDIELSSLKTIAAFLNTNGGTLLIGINDSAQVVGLKREIEKFWKNKNDKFLLNFKNAIQSKIGEEFYPFINHKIVSIDNLDIVLVECKKSTKGCFLNKKDFYVRTNPATDKLEGPQLVEYINNHFSN